MKLTREIVERTAREYGELEPLDAVEREHVEMLPETFAGGEFGWRDAEWVVQWYYRRYLGAYPDRERREAETAFGENDFDDVVDVLVSVAEDGDVREKLRRLTGLSGVDVPVGSAFLQYIFPDRYVVVGDREWTVLREAGELDRAYPDPPGIEEYVEYDGACTAVRERLDVDPWTLYRAIWRLGDR